jgi:hypothetical protein
MHRLVLTLCCAGALAAAPAVAQPVQAPAGQGAAAAKGEATKTATGTITSISGSSVTVKTSTGDMTFNIDSKTRVIEPGAGTKNRAAQAEGKMGAVVTDLLKTGENVEVKYHETGMHAASIRQVAVVGAPASASAKAQTATGTVTSVTGNSLAIKAASGEMTFTVDNKTTVTGTGLGTAGRKLEAEGAKPTVSALLKEGDTVSVTYHDVAGTNHASAVRVVRKKM